jgi:serine/threonine-protein kinase
MALQAGQIVADKYRIVRLLGQGGMGEVYEGENVRIHRRVAIKTLLASVSSRSDVVQRFEREAQAAGRIGSEHIVEVLDLGDLPDGSRYMVMEFLEGSTLSDRIVSRGRVPPREAARIVMELCDGLAAAHVAGIIHRDLKPANVFLLASKAGRPDFVKILDFGVSKFSVLGDEMSMTRTGAVVGTPYYMSPEQAKGAKLIDARSDLYSVGVILYESITGQVPFNAQTFNELIFKIALETPPPPESFVPNLDPHFAGIVRKAMAREPNDRFQSAAEFKHALESWAQAFDRGAGPSGSGAFAGSGAALGGGTQILGPDAFAGPRAPAPAPEAGRAVAAPARASSGGSAGVAFALAAVAMLLLGGGAAAAFFFLKKPHAPQGSTSAARTEPTTEPSGPAAPTSAKSSAAPIEQPPPADSVAGPSASAASVASLPDASSAAAPGKPPSGPLPTARPTAGPAKPPPTSAPTSQPTAKPTSGRPITGDL